ncbi:MAG: hypothetical protein ACRERE_40525 [Candidatus Entotheonellia bacterium]
MYIGTAGVLIIAAGVSVEAQSPGPLGRSLEHLAKVKRHDSRLSPGPIDHSTIQLETESRGAHEYEVF